jgi:diguanylate cyclase (GGDEF)-like protein
MHNNASERQPELADVLRRRALLTHFQPIVNAADGRLFAHEALLRGPPDTHLSGPLALFAASKKCGMALQLDLLAVQLAVERFAHSGSCGKLFVNLLPQTLAGFEGFSRWLSEVLLGANLSPDQLVIEITEHGEQLDASPLRAQGTKLRALGCEIAIDDFGTGLSGLKIWSELRPDYVKIDRYFISRVEEDSVAIEILRAMLDMAHVMGSRVVAEGIENERQMELLRGIGVDYLQGFHISRPLAEASIQTGEFRIPPMLATRTAGVSCVGDLCVQREPLSADARIGEAVEIFQANPEWDSLPIVADGKPLGVLRRDALLLKLSKPLYPEIYNPKPVTRLMEPHVLVIDERTRLNQASRLITRNRNSRINEDFVIACDGRYRGLGRSIELLHHITEQQLREAQQSNPLTLLPGNREIDSQVFRLLALRAPFTICHLDIDHFKPFNDHYGYSQGDQVLLNLAGLCRSAVAEGLDFAGHPGGDDFILIMRSLDWSRRVSRIVESFSATCARFYSHGNQETEGFEGLDRDGKPRMFPFMTLSVGVAVAAPNRYENGADLMRALSAAKQNAKTRRGNSVIMNDGGKDQTLQLRALSVA